MDVSPQVSPGRQTRAMHSADPFSANSRILVQVQNMGYVNISEREDGDGSILSESESQWTSQIVLQQMVYQFHSFQLVG